MSETDADRPSIALLGIPIEIGASQAGALMGPDALRTAGIGRILDSARIFGQGSRQSCDTGGRFGPATAG